MSDTTDLSITSEKESTNDAVLNTTTALTTFAQNVDPELAEKLHKLAKQTSPTIKGFEDETKASIPQIYIRQPSSSGDALPAECKLGQLYNSAGDIVGDSLNFIPILTHNLRKKWGEDQLECLSLDGKVGTRYGACADCPYGRFEKGTPPACSPGFTFYGVTTGLENIYRIDFLKSSSKAGRNIRRLIRPPALWSRSFEVSTEKVTGNNRNYYVLKTAPTGNVTEEQISEVCDMLHSFFKAEYDKAIASQKVYAQRLAASNDSEIPQDAVIVEEEGDNIDFSDSM